MAGIDLTDRIRMLDRMAQKNSVPSVFEPAEIEAEAEEELISQVDMSQAEDMAVESIISKKEETCTETPSWALELIEAVEGLKNEIIKMNKHVNSIQKFIKKGK